MKLSDNIGSQPAAWSYVSVQSYSCSLRSFYRILVVGKDNNNLQSHHPPPECHYQHLTLGQAIVVALFSDDKRAVLIPGIKEKQIIGITKGYILTLSSMLPIFLPVSADRILAFFSILSSYLCSTIFQ